MSESSATGLSQLVQSMGSPSRSFCNPAQYKIPNLLIQRGMELQFFRRRPSSSLTQRSPLHLPSNTSNPQDINQTEAGAGKGYRNTIFLVQASVVLRSISSLCSDTLMPSIQIGPTDIEIGHHEPHQPCIAEPQGLASQRFSNLELDC